MTKDGPPPDPPQPAAPLPEDPGDLCLGSAISVSGAERKRGPCRSGSLGPHLNPPWLLGRGQGASVGSWSPGTQPGLSSLLQAPSTAEGTKPSCSCRQAVSFLST